MAETKESGCQRCDELRHTRLTAKSIHYREDHPEAWELGARNCREGRWFANPYEPESPEWWAYRVSWNEVPWHETPVRLGGECRESA